MPDLTALRMLDAVATRGSFSAAAEVLGVSQQAVSARMRQLETQLGLELFVRTARGTAMSETGTVVAGWAADVVASADRLVERAALLRGDVAGSFAVAASLTVAEYLLPRWLVALQAVPATAAVRVAVTATNSRSVVQLVRSGSHPVGFIESPEDVGDLRARLIASDELVLVVAPSHPWAGRRSVTAARLAATRLVSREDGSGTRLAFERTLAAAGAGPLAPPLVELPTSSGIRTAVAAGTAPAVLSILTVRDDVASGRLVQVPVKDVRFIRELRAVFRTGAVLSPPVEALLKIARG